MQRQSRETGSWFIKMSFAQQVWWMLKGNTQVPKPNDAGHDKFFSRWTKTLSETNARDNSPELKFKAF